MRRVTRLLSVILKMNSRKLLFYAGVAASALLFIAGIIILIYIKTYGLGSLQANADIDSKTGAGSSGDIFKPFMTSNTPFNVLVIGGDRVNDNSDTMMLVNYDPSSSKINLMSIPRDTRVIIDKKYRKINFAYPSGGMDLAASTVSGLLDVNIKYYVYLDTSAFRKIVDLLGGVDIYVPVDLDYDDPMQNLHIHLKKGLQHLDGNLAEQYVRFRDNHLRKTKEFMQYYDGSDLDRIKAQQAFLKEAIRQKLNVQYLPRIKDIMQVFYQNVETNFTMNELMGLSLNLAKLNIDSFNFVQLPGKTIDGSPYYYCDVEKARELTAQYYKCDSSFVPVDRDAGDIYSDNSVDGKNTDNGKKDVTKGNPSNGDSSLNSAKKPAP